jgi:predicted DNA-binding WGR domain protein
MGLETMLIAALAKVDAASNTNCYYDIEISRDLFGEWAVVRKWGRVGANPRQKRDACVSKEAAQELAQKIRALKERKGYVGRSAIGHLTPRPWIICRGSPKNSASPLTTDDPLRAKRTWEEIDQIQQLLFEFCSAKSQGRWDSLNSLVESDPAGLLDMIASRLVRLLSSGETINDMHTRLVMQQSISMIDIESRDRRKLPDSNVVEMIPKALHPYLNYSVSSFFAKSRGSNDISAKLSEAGIARVGDLVQRTESDVSQILIRQSAMATVRRVLKDIGLRFGMCVPPAQRSRQIA